MRHYSNTRLTGFDVADLSKLKLLSSVFDRDCKKVLREDSPSIGAACLDGDIGQPEPADEPPE